MNSVDHISSGKQGTSRTPTGNILVVYKTMQLYFASRALQAGSTSAVVLSGSFSTLDMSGILATTRARFDRVEVRGYNARQVPS